MRIEVGDGHCAMTTDIWTDDYRKISYMALTVHYINSDWKICERVLCTSHMEEKKTAENIRAKVRLGNHNTSWQM